MRILILSNKAPYPPKDGGSIATLGLTVGLVQQGCEVTILAMNTKKHHITPFELPAELTSQIIFHLVEVPAPVRLSGLLKNLFFSELPYNAERFIDRYYSSALIQLLEHNEYDLIQLEGLYVTPYIETIRKYSQAKISFRSHNIEHEIWQRTLNQSHGFKKIYLKNMASRLKTFELNAIDRYDLLIPITSRDEQLLAQMGNSKPTIAIPAGIKIESHSKNKRVESKNNLFFIGALDWSPNQEGLLWFIDHCWAKIKKTRPETVLKVAGRNAPQWLIEKLKKAHIIYCGEVDDAYQFMSTNGVMIAPLLSGSGMRVKLIEGMLHYKAIVTTPVGCEGIPVIHNEQMCIATTPDEFIRQCLKLLQKPQRAIDMGLKANIFVVNRYDNTQLASKLINFYKAHL